MLALPLPGGAEVNFERSWEKLVLYAGYVYVMLVQHLRYSTVGKGPHVTGYFW